MKSIKLTAILLMAGAGFTFQAPQVVAQVNQADAEINIIPDKTTKTEEGIRISLCIVGLPTTSHKIDGIDLVMGNKLVKASYVEGIEFETPFTIDDTGVQTVDVDFPFNGTLSKTAKLVFHTAAGDITAPARQ